MPTRTFIKDWDGTPPGAYGQSWQALDDDLGITARGVSREVRKKRPDTQFYTMVGGRKYEISGKFVSLDLEVRADPQMRAFFRRLDVLEDKSAQKAFTKVLREVTRTKILPTLRKEVPRGRSPYRPYRLASTATIFRVFSDKVVLTVGSKRKWEGPRGGRYGLWTASIVHARWHPFFPATFRKTWRPFNRALEKELRDLMKYLAGKSIRFRGVA